MHSSSPTHDCQKNISCHQKSASAFPEETLSYVACSQDYELENSAFTEKVIREIAEENLTPIGFMGSDLRENIQYFILMQFAPAGGRKCVLERPLCGAQRPPAVSYLTTTFAY